MKYKKQLLILVFILIFISIITNGKKEEVSKQIEVEMPSVNIELVDEGFDIYDPGSGHGYRYGASCIKNDDGSMDMWFSRPGNGSTMWDYICHKHFYEDGECSYETIVLKPNYDSLDHYSVCDPGVIYFDGYYYLGYTGTINPDGYQNQIFVSRSEYPDGPFEKWNGSGWGGKPQPIISYEGTNWGMGEISFVIKDEDLFCYYTCYDDNEISTHCSKADLVEDWPNTLRYKGVAYHKENLQDSCDVVYLEDTNMFLAFSIGNRMQNNSRVLVYSSLDGKVFFPYTSLKENVKDNAHNLGISKNLDGHIDLEDDLCIIYAYSNENIWGKWKTLLQKISIY